MAEPIAALIVRILADTSEMVTGVKNVSGQLDSFENRVMKFGKSIAGAFTVGAVTAFAKQILDEANQIDAAAKRVGASAEEFQRFAYAAKLAGIDAGAAEQNISTLNAKLGANDGGLLNVLRKLNISADEFRAKDPVQRYIDLGVALAGIADPATRAAMAVEAMGSKGEKALSAIDGAFKEQAANAVVYSQQDIEALNAIGNAFDRLEAKAKVTVANILLALGRLPKAIFSMPPPSSGDGTTGSGSFADAKVGGMPNPRYNGEGPMVPPNIPGSPLTPPAALLPGGIDPNDAKAVALAIADLDLQYVKVTGDAKLADEEWKQQIDILRMLKIETPGVSDALGKLMDKMGTTTKVEHLTQRIIDLAMTIRDLRIEEERLLEVINPGSTKVAGDDVDRKLFDLRSDSRNFGADGNLTPQALEIEQRLIGNFNLGLLARQLQPVSAPSGLAMGSAIPGFQAGAAIAPQITINAQGSWWDSPDRINQMARTIEDSIARRSGLASTYSRR